MSKPLLLGAWINVISSEPTVDLAQSIIPNCGIVGCANTGVAPLIVPTEANFAEILS